jgi:phosphoadenosine phosphosulfate reductase
MFEQSALALSDEGYYLCFSGGKDSIVLAKLAEMAGVKHRLHTSNTTIDPPELIYFIREHYPHTIWEGKNRIPLPLAFIPNGPPSRIKRWCCLQYKETSGQGTFKLTGVRAPESVRRKGLWREVNPDRDSAVGKIICPIAFWTDDDIWAFIRQNNMPYCKLYDEGFKRLGCIGCPMNTKRKSDFARWPRYERLWKLGFQKYWDEYRNKPNKKGEIWLCQRGRILELVDRGRYRRRGLPTVFVVICSPRSQYSKRR